jgi:hypothetical protein
MAFRLVRRIRTVMLMVPACPESGSLGRAARAAAHELTGNPVLVVPM